MSNDTSYSLNLRHPKKSCLQEIKIYLTVVKPAISRFYENIKFDPTWSREKCLGFLGIKRWGEVVTWFGPDSDSTIGKIVRNGDFHEMEAGAWANEGGGNVWISGPDGELADLLDRFAGLEITGSFLDSYGAGSVKGFEKIHEMDRIEYDIQDPDSWEEGCESFSLATKELLVASNHGELDLKRLRRLIKEGADVNAIWLDSPFISRLNVDALKTSGELPEMLALILEGGWRYDPDACFSNREIAKIADALDDPEASRPVRLKMAAALLGRNPLKDEDEARLFSLSLKARDIRGVLAAAFLGLPLAKEALRQSGPDRRWLEKQDLPISDWEWRAKHKRQ